MSEMVERVARALYEGALADHRAGLRPLVFADMTGPDHRYWLARAREAIVAMREPTEAMVDAAMSFGWQPEPLNIGYDDAWRVMIDAALGLPPNAGRPCDGSDGLAEVAGEVGRRP